MLLIIDRMEEEQFTIQLANGFSDTTKILTDVVVFVNILLEILKDEKKEWKIIRLQTSKIHDFLRCFTTVGRCRLIMQKWTLNTDQACLLMASVRLRCIASDLFDRLAERRGNHSCSITDLIPSHALKESYRREVVQHCTCSAQRRYRKPIQSPW